MIFDRLLHALSPAEFVKQVYTRLPFSQPRLAEQVTSGIDWPLVARLLAQAEADVIIGREGQRLDRPQLLDLAALRDLMAGGSTLGIRHAQKLDGELLEVATEFEKALGGPADVHLYCTPAGHPGFGWHYDAEEVFILQARGSKEWWLRKNTVNPWPLLEAIPANQRYEREIMPVYRCLLQAGDWLYIPNGYWHRTQAGEESISLSIGIRAPVRWTFWIMCVPKLGSRCSGGSVCLARARQPD